MVESIEYIGRGKMIIQINDARHQIPVESLLKFEFCEDEDIIYGEGIRKFMFTCTCGQYDISPGRLKLTGVTLSGHYEWRECFAVRVLIYYLSKFEPDIGDIIPVYDYDIHEFFMLAQLGYPRMLDNILDGLKPSLTPDCLTALARGNDLCLDAALIIYKMQGKVTESARV